MVIVQNTSHQSCSILIEIYEDAPNLKQRVQYTAGPELAKMILMCPPRKMKGTGQEFYIVIGTALKSLLEKCVKDGIICEGFWGEFGHSITPR